MKLLATDPPATLMTSFYEPSSLIWLASFLAVSKCNHNLQSLNNHFLTGLTRDGDGGWYEDYREAAEKQSEVTYEKGICKQHTAQDWLTS